MEYRVWKFVGLTALIFALFLGLAFADSSNRYVRIRHVEGDVTVYPSDRDRSSDAVVNTPLLEGDEIETQNGRVEMTYHNGIIVRLGDYSAARIDSTYNPMSIELLKGNLFVDSRLVDNLREELEVRAGDSQVFLIEEGNMRVDLGTEGTVRVTSVKGEAEVRASGGRVLLQPGERTYVDPGKSPDSPEVFDSDYDELDDWNESRMDAYLNDGRDQYNDEHDRYVDDSLYYDTYDLNNYGDWRAYSNYGNVWIPRVSYGWRPYDDGRWMSVNDGWFWVSNEPWGWTPYHYGRWGWGLDIGWYWIPGYAFAPSWVSWYDYGDYLGWCPLNYWNRPVVIYNDFRGNLPYIQKQKTLNVANAWTFIKKNDLGASNVKVVRLRDPEMQSIKLDATRVAKAPPQQLKSLVLPTRQVKPYQIQKPGQVPSLVNDKRIVKPSEDVKNPYGVEHRDFYRKPSERVNQTAKHPDRKIETGSSPARPQIVSPKDREGEFSFRPSRDDQFKRIVRPGVEGKENGRKPLGPYVSPYYRDYKRNNDNLDENAKEAPWYRDRDPYTNEKEISPRYLDEAKKMFERLQEDRNSDRNSPKSYQTPPPDIRRDGGGRDIKVQRPPQSNRNQAPPPRSKPAGGQQKEKH
jgi:hypothetical protein